jgi:hypothetical protein
LRSSNRREAAVLGVGKVGGQETAILGPRAISTAAEASRATTDGSDLAELSGARQVVGDR